MTITRHIQRRSPAPGAADVELSAIRERICESVIRECTPLLPRIKAIVLTGSVARDEASFVYRHRQLEALGDAEFLLINKGRGQFYSNEVLESVRNRIEEHLDKHHQIRCKIDLSHVGSRYLRRLPPHVFTYELKSCGTVIWGDRQVLTRIPDFAPNDLSRTDAFRLLCNRLIELLEFAPQDNHPSAGVADIQYRITKLYLDMATSFLVFVGGYAPSYLERNTNLQEIANRTCSPANGPDLRHFAQLVDCSTQRKLRPLTEADAISGLDLPEAIQFARQLWRWELTRLARTCEGSSDRQLFGKWSTTQPLWQRLRGWAYVIRACGWHRSYRQWPHWARLARQMSPRTAVYLAASLLVFGKLARFDSPDDKPDGLKEIRELLPVQPAFIDMHTAVSAADLARAIVWNYKAFLERTRS